MYTLTTMLMLVAFGASVFYAADVAIEEDEESDQ